MAKPNTEALSKHERAYRLIRSRIMSGELAPGHRLVLSQLAAQLECSVMPVREAIRQLEAEELVVFESNIGARVAMIDPRDYQESMQVVATLDGLATATSAPHLTVEQIAQARAVNDQMAALINEMDPAKFTRLNREFHGILVSAAPNVRLRELVDLERERMDRLRESTFAFIPERALASVQEHERILRLIEAQADADYLERLVREHSLTTLETYLRSTEKSATADAPEVN